MANDRAFLIKIKKWLLAMYGTHTHKFTSLKNVVISALHKTDKRIHIQAKMLFLEYARKRTHNGCLIQMESPVTQDNCLASLGKPRNAEELPS